jgi:hypothetical protein
MSFASTMVAPTNSSSTLDVGSGVGGGGVGGGVFTSVFSGDDGGAGYNIAFVVDKIAERFADGDGVTLIHAHGGHILGCRDEKKGH